MTPEFWKVRAIEAREAAEAQRKADRREREAREVADTKRGMCEALASVGLGADELANLIYMTNCTARQARASLDGALFVYCKDRDYGVSGTLYIVLDTCPRCGAEKWSGPIADLEDLGVALLDCDKLPQPHRNAMAGDDWCNGGAA